MVIKLQPPLTPPPISARSSIVFKPRFTQDNSYFGTCQTIPSAFLISITDSCVVSMKQAVVTAVLAQAHINILV